VVLPLSLSAPLIDYKELKIEQVEIGSGNFSKVHKYVFLFCNKFNRGTWRGKEVAVKKITLKKTKDPELAMTEFQSEVGLLGYLCCQFIILLVPFHIQIW
jgi:hypothetical protein